MVYYNSSTYNALKIPMMDHFSNLSRYDLLNTFSSNILLNEDSKAFYTMLTPVLRSIKVIY